MKSLITNSFIILFSFALFESASADECTFIDHEVRRCGSGETICIDCGGPAGFCYYRVSGAEKLFNVCTLCQGPCDYAPFSSDGAPNKDSRLARFGKAISSLQSDDLMRIGRLFERNPIHAEMVVLLLSKYSDTKETITIQGSGFNPLQSPQVDRPEFGQITDAHHFLDSLLTWAESASRSSGGQVNEYAEAMLIPDPDNEKVQLSVSSWAQEDLNLSSEVRPRLKTEVTLKVETSDQGFAFDVQDLSYGSPQ